MVLEITRSMVATVDLDSLLSLIIERSMELLDAERATVFLYDESSDELVSRVAAGVDEIRFPASRGISGATVQTRSTTVVPDAYADERFNPDIDQATGFRTRSILSVPLFDYAGKLVGVLQVLNKRSGDFDGYDVSLAEILAAQAGVVVQRANLIEHYLHKQQMERAMRIAREIQQGLLPVGSPDVAGFDITGFSEPADETGGDMYDFFRLPDGRWMVVVADASGHGIGPALVIAETRAMLRAVSLQGSDVATVLSTVNKLLSADVQESRFVTCFFGLLDPAASHLTYASAGHGPLIFYNRKTDTFDQALSTSVPLGLMPEIGYEQTVTHSFVPGDFAVIMTDGLFEAVNPEGKQFGVQRIIDLLRQNSGLPAEQMVNTARKAVRRFTAGQPQADDLTAIAIRKT